MNGVVKLAELPAGTPASVPVIVTFLPTGDVNLRQHGIDAAQAAELRARLSAFAEDWDTPEMAAYDDYHAAKSKV